MPDGDDMMMLHPVAREIATIDSSGHVTFRFANYEKVIKLTEDRQSDMNAMEALRDLAVFADSVAHAVRDSTGQKRSAFGVSRRPSSTSGRLRLASTITMDPDPTQTWLKSKEVAVDQNVVRLVRAVIARRCSSAARQLTEKPERTPGGRLRRTIAHVDWLHFVEKRHRLIKAKATQGVPLDAYTLSDANLRRTLARVMRSAIPFIDGDLWPRFAEVTDGCVEGIVVDARLGESCIPGAQVENFFILLRHIKKIIKRELESKKSRLNVTNFDELVRVYSRNVAADMEKTRAIIPSNIALSWSDDVFNSCQPSYGSADSDHERDARIVIPIPTADAESKTASPSYISRLGMNITDFKDVQDIISTDIPFDETSMTNSAQKSGTYAVKYSTDNDVRIITEKYDECVNRVNRYKQQHTTPQDGNDEKTQRTDYMRISLGIDNILQELKEVKQDSNTPLNEKLRKMEELVDRAADRAQLLYFALQKQRSSAYDLSHAESTLQSLKMDDAELAGKLNNVAGMSNQELEALVDSVKDENQRRIIRDVVDRILLSREAKAQAEKAQEVIKDVNDTNTKMVEVKNADGTIRKVKADKDGNPELFYDMFPHAQQGMQGLMTMPGQLNNMGSPQVGGDGTNALPFFPSNYSLQQTPLQAVMLALIAGSMVPQQQHPSFHGGNGTRPVNPYKRSD